MELKNSQKRWHRTNFRVLKGEMKFIKELAEPAVKNSDPYWFIFMDTKLLIQCDGKKKYTIPCFGNPGTLGIPCVRTQYLGRYNDICCFSGEIMDAYEILNAYEIKGAFELPENM